METKELGNYILDILDITEFKDYYYKNKDSFTGVAMNSFLKALDIPPKFFKEQPIETQEELIENRDTFVRETKKFFNKVIVVVKTKFGDTLNAARLDKNVATVMYEKLSPINDIANKFEHRSFVKDGYSTFVISNDIKKGVDNNVLVVDFPILMNKPVVLHKAMYTLPDETFVTPIEHIQYKEDQITCTLTGPEANYTDVKEAINDNIGVLEQENEATEEQNILREVEVVSLALIEGGVIPKKALEKVRNYLTNNTQGGLTTRSLEKLVLDFDETFTSYKQVTALRGINGYNILAILESDQFKEFIKQMNNIEE